MMTTQEIIKIIKDIIAFLFSLISPYLYNYKKRKKRNKKNKENIKDNNNQLKE